MQTPSISEKLIRWYQQNHRDLPWRNTTDPYKIWLSEIILQQTRVQQGLPYYEKFITQYPTVFDLAKAPEEEVLRLWQGLGYYSRARNLMAAAKQVVEDYKGEFPSTYQEIIKLKGVGSYTAAAIASFAFKEKVAVVDGNVFRVLSRLFGVDEDIASTTGKKTFEKLANEVISEKAPDMHNQAIMEFGAMHCTPQKPNCMFCPFVQSCEARKTGRQDQLPVKLKRTKVRPRYFHYFVFRIGEKVYFKQRTEKDIWQGMYDFYLIERDNVADWDSLSADGLISELTSLGELEIKKSDETFKHILSHQHIFAEFFQIKLDGNQEALIQCLEKNSLKGFSLEEIEELPKPVLILKFLEKEEILDPSLH